MSSFEHCVVLVADDEPAVLRIVSYVLTRHGYIVIPASDGLAALKACLEKEGPIHLALLDVMMSGMTGPELFECAKLSIPKRKTEYMAAASDARQSHFGHLIVAAGGMP